MRNKRAWFTVLGITAGVVGAYWLTRAYRQANKTPLRTDRPVYTTTEEFIADLNTLWARPADLKALRRNPAIQHPLTAKIILVMTGTSGYAVGGVARTRYAREQGLSDLEITSLLRGEMEHATVDEAPALVFAQHYVQRLGKPDTDMMQRLASAYGTRTARDLLFYMHIIAIGDRIGNTIDALWYRILGHPLGHSHPRTELGVLAVLGLGALPLLPLMWLRTAMAEPIAA